MADEQQAWHGRRPYRPWERTGHLPTLAGMAVLRLFASVRVAAGTGEVEVPGSTVSQVVGAACDRFGTEFADLAQNCRVWLNGDPAAGDEPVSATDEVAILPPVSGGC
ncbi:MAG: molybdopterin synthase sulfur carrier subunit [Actinobacteria bacterium]|nr:molybdopterin synthase sulfur carrier subunit [Actinomycetota bacterium]